jgi:hypothetical protein
MPALVMKFVLVLQEPEFRALICELAQAFSYFESELAPVIQQIVKL